MPTKNKTFSANCEQIVNLGKYDEKWVCMPNCNIKVA